MRTQSDLEKFAKQCTALGTQITDAIFRYDKAVGLTVLPGLMAAIATAAEMSRDEIIARYDNAIEVIKDGERTGWDIMVEDMRRRTRDQNAIFREGLTAIAEGKREARVIARVTLKKAAAGSFHNVE